MKYEAPVIAIEVLNTEDVVLVSNIKVEAEGSLKTIDWTQIG